jgi:hypothetical protein
MGWSIENIRPQMDSIFKAEGKAYRMNHPNALSPRVYLQHEGKLSQESKDKIVSLFPEFVYVDFFPNLEFGEDSVKFKQLKGRKIE